jgi:hypothetical protein
MLHRASDLTEILAAFQERLSHMELLACLFTYLLTYVWERADKLKVHEQYAETC